MYPLESAFHKATEGAVSEAFGQGIISQVKGQGVSELIPKPPFFIGLSLRCYEKAKVAEAICLKNKVVF